MVEAPAWNVESAQRAYAIASTMNRDTWVPASGGTETPCLYQGKYYLYVYNPKLKQHAWYDMRSDLLIDSPPWGI
jgi:hypothetical protein